MKAIAIERFGGPEELKEMELDDPLVGPDSVLIRVKAASVNPVDYKIRSGKHESRFPHFFPLIPGWDAAGVVEEVGPAVVEFSPGDEVYTYCRKDFVRDGAYAELVSVRAPSVARKPEKLDFVEAAAVPLAGLTAYQALHDTIGLASGETVLVHAGAGGVGGFGVQIAKAAGAHVIATASARNHDYVRGLGADQVIDYQDEDFVEAVKDSHPDGIDAVFDLLGGETLERSEAVLHDGGRITSIVEPPDRELFGKRQIRSRYTFVRPDAGELHRLAHLIDNDEMTVTVAEVFPLTDARRAHETIEQGHTRGKLVLELDGD